MSFFLSGESWLKLPSGHIVQWGIVDVLQNKEVHGDVTEFRQGFSFPIAFPNNSFINLTKWDTTGWWGEYVLQYYPTTRTGFTVIVGHHNNNLPSDVSNKVTYIAWGK